MNLSTRDEGKITACVALAGLSLSIGYLLGVKSRPTYGQGKPESTSKKSDPLEECKLALVVRTDLGMSTGKIAAQCSHATLACYKSLERTNSMLLRQWEHSGQTKVVLRCEDEEELLLLEAQAQSLNLCARHIQDAGRTQIIAGSRTVLGVLGPARLVNQVTGRLRLL